MATDELILARTLGLDLHPRRPRPRRAARAPLPSVPGAAGGARVACLFRDHALSDLIGFTYSGWARRRRRRRLRRPPGRGRPAVTPIGRAGERRVIPSSSTARTPGSTSRAAAGRSCARSTARSSTIPTADRDDVGGVRRRATQSLNGIFPGSWINAQLLHLDRARRRPSGVGQLARRAAGARRPGRAATPRPWRGRARNCSSPKAATGSGGTATTTRRSTTSSSTTCSVGTSGTSIGRSTSRSRRALRHQHHDRAAAVARAVGLCARRPRRGGDELLRVARRRARWSSGRPAGRCTRSSRLAPVADGQLLFGFDRDRLYVRAGLRAPRGDLLVGRRMLVSFMHPADVRLRSARTGLRASRAPARHGSARTARRRRTPCRTRSSRSASAGIRSRSGEPAVLSPRPHRTTSSSARVIALSSTVRRRVRSLQLDR